MIYVGGSNFAGWHIAAAQETAKARHFLGLVSEQSIYNLMERTIELEVMPAARHYGIGLMPWSPLAGGLLAGAAAKAGRRGGQQRHARPFRPRTAHRRQPDPAQAYEDLAAELELSPDGAGPGVAAVPTRRHRPHTRPPYRSSS